MHLQLPLNVLETIPSLRMTQGTPFEDKILHGHIALGDRHWYIAEYSIKQRTFYGCSTIDGTDEIAWDYFCLDRLCEPTVEQSREFMYDSSWTARPAKMVLATRR